VERRLAAHPFVPAEDSDQANADEHSDSWFGNHAAEIRL